MNGRKELSNGNDWDTVELVDTLDLGSNLFSGVGSSPAFLRYISLNSL